MRLKKQGLWAGNVAQWTALVLPAQGPEFHSPAPQKKDKKPEIYFLSVLVTVSSIRHVVKSFPPVIYG